MSLCELTCETAAGDEEDAEEELSITRRSHVFSLAAWTDALEMPVLFCALSLGPGGFCTHSLSSPLPLSSSFYSSNGWKLKSETGFAPSWKPPVYFMIHHILSLKGSLGQLLGSKFNSLLVTSLSHLRSMCLISELIL